MYTPKALRSIFEGRLREAHEAPGALHDYARARVLALREIFDDLGLGSNDLGEPLLPIDDRGLPNLNTNGTARPDEFSLRHVGEAIFGHDLFEQIYHPSGGFNFGLSRYLHEAAVGPEAFVDINTYNLAIAGLVNAEIMRRFQAPDYIGKNVVTIKPTKMNGQAFIGVVGIRPASALAKGRKPGEAHAMLGLGSAKQLSPETVEQAAKCVVTREAAFFDLTGDVLEAAGGVGDELAYGQEREIADEVMGITNSYNRNGTSYNTYQTAAPFVNDHVNPFTDEVDVDDARQLFVNMRDPETAREIRIDGRTILCMPGLALKVREQIFGTNVQIGTQLNSSFPSRWKTSTGELANVGAANGGRGPYQVVEMSAIWFNRATAPDGLNLSAADARGLWFLGDFAGPPGAEGFIWMENWPLTPWQASADEYLMKDHGLIAVYGANYRGRMFTREPRRAVRNKAA